MNYLKLPYMDAPVSVFDICQAHAQLETDYNVNGILWARPSNARRKASTGTQLSRMQFSSRFNWVDILHPCVSEEDEDAVRDIYLINVLKWHLPMEDEMKAFVELRYAPKFLKEIGYEKV